MPYETAIKCFQENGDLISPPGDDVERLMLWNLNAGLIRLTEALMTDMRAGAATSRIGAEGLALIDADL